jgi:hypothetical protein
VLAGHQRYYFIHLQIIIIQISILSKITIRRWFIGRLRSKEDKKWLLFMLPLDPFSLFASSR